MRDTRRPGPGERADATDWTRLRRRQRRRAAHRAARWRQRAWAATYLGTAVVATVGGAGLLARWSSPEQDWWIQVAAATLPVVGPASLVSAAVLWSRWLRDRRFGSGLCAVALTALFAGWALRTSSPRPAPSDPADQLRLMALNTGASNGREGYVADYVQRTRPDVIVLQEAGVSWGPYAPVVARIAALGGYTIHTDSLSEGKGSRQVTLTRLPVRSYESGYLAAREERAGVYSRTVVEWGGEAVAVYNVHLRAFNPGAGWSWQRALSPSVWAETPRNLRGFFSEQSAEAMALARMVREEPLPTVVAGDFNSVPDQWNRAILARTLREVTGRWLPGATRPDGFPLVNVDGILVGDAWAVGAVETGPPGLSDHRALTALLQLEH